MVDEITSHLRTLILRGDLPPQARLVELDIAAQSKASQASVREALQRLERDGLVVRRGRKGTFVTDVSPDEIGEIFVIRKMVESFAVRRGIRSIRAEQIRELNQLVDRMREMAQAGDTAALVEYDMAFHQRICAWAEQPTLIRTWTLLYMQIERFLVLYDARHFTDLTFIADSHLPIIAALETGDAEAAARRIEEHIEYVMRRTPQLVFAPDGGRTTGVSSIRATAS